MMIYNLKDPIYDYKLNLIADCDYEEFRQFILDADSFDCGGFRDKTVGMYVPIRDKNVYYLYIKDANRLPVLAHEVLHMIFDMLESKGLSLCDESEEAYTYSFEFWLALVLSKLTTK